MWQEWEQATCMHPIWCNNNLGGHQGLLQTTHLKPLQSISSRSIMQCLHICIYIYRYVSLHPSQSLRISHSLSKSLFFVGTNADDSLESTLVKWARHIVSPELSRHDTIMHCLPIKTSAWDNLQPKSMGSIPSRSIMHTLQYLLDTVSRGWQVQMHTLQYLLDTVSRGWQVQDGHYKQHVVFSQWPLSASDKAFAAASWASTMKVLWLQSLHIEAVASHLWAQVHGHGQVLCTSTSNSW